MRIIVTTYGIPYLGEGEGDQSFTTPSVSADATTVPDGLNTAWVTTARCSLYSSCKWWVDLANLLLLLQLQQEMA